MTAGRDITAVSGRDTSLAGVNMGAENIYLDVGRNLTVASRQNDSSNSSWGFNFSVTFNPSSPRW